MGLTKSITTSRHLHFNHSLSPGQSRLFTCTYSTRHGEHRMQKAGQWGSHPPNLWLQLQLTVSTFPHQRKSIHQSSTLRSKLVALFLSVAIWGTFPAYRALTAKPEDICTVWGVSCRQTQSQTCITREALRGITTGQFRKGKNNVVESTQEQHREKRGRVQGKKTEHPSPSMQREVWEMLRFLSVCLCACMLGGCLMLVSSWSQFGFVQCVFSCKGPHSVLLVFFVQWMWSPQWRSEASSAWQ